MPKVFLSGTQVFPQNAPSKTIISATLPIMQQIKIFKALETGTDELESEINQWLAKNPGRVIQIIGNIAPQSQKSSGGDQYLSKSPHSPSDILVIVLYEPNK